MGVALAVGLGGAWAVAPAGAEEMMKMDPAATQETIYGSELMTEQERNTYRQRLTEAKTEEERAQIRTQHHEQMWARAKEKGVTLPEQPAMMGGKGMGMEKSMGGGHPAAK